MVLSLISCCGFDISSNWKGWNDKQGSPIKFSGPLNEWQRSFDKNGSTNTYIYLLEGLIQTFKANRFIWINCKCLNISGWDEKGPATCDLLQTLAISRPQQPPWTQVSLLMFLFLLLLFLLCAIANTMNQKRFSSFFF